MYSNERIRLTVDENGYPTPKTSPKVIATASGASVGAALATVVVWGIEFTTKVDLPDVVEGSISVIFVAAIGWAAGYIKKP